MDSDLPMHFGLVEDPTTDAERAQLAGTCVDELDLPMPALIDGVDDAVGRAYAGWPDRLYLVSVDGTIAYAGAPGPRGFAPDAWQQAIAAEVARIAAAGAGAKGTSGNGKPPAKDATPSGGGR